MSSVLNSDRVKDSLTVGGHANIKDLREDIDLKSQRLNQSVLEERERRNKVLERLSQLKKSVKTSMSSETEFA